MVSRHQPKTNIWRHRQNREPQICKLKWFVKNGQSIWGWPQNSWLWSYTRSISQGYSSTWCYQYECHLGLSSQMSDGNIGKSKIVTAMKPPVTECSISEHTHTKKKALPKLKNTTGPSDVIAATTKGVAVLYYAVHLATFTRHNWRMAVLRRLKLLVKSGEIETNGNHAVLPSSAILMSKNQ